MASLDPAAPVAAVSPPSSASYIDWGAIIAGAVLAAAISTLMTTFGAAIGLSSTSPFTGEGISANALGIATAIYIIWVLISSFLAGGYLAGRMRRRVGDGTPHESEVRDGSHGLVVWALGTIMIAVLATSAVGGAIKVGADAAGGSIKALTQASGPIDVAIDRLIRSNGQNAPSEAFRSSVTRIIGNGVATGTLSDSDKSYLTSQIAALAGVSPDEATRRVNDAVAQVNALSEKAKQAAERARKVGVIIGFLSAASLAIAAAAAWFAATMGGKHRDDGVAFSPMTSWR